jgi:hypothetical protein
MTTGPLTSAKFNRERDIPDPSWIIGLYDASDFDDVVSELMDASGTGGGGSTVAGAAFSVFLVASSVASCTITGLAAGLARCLRSPPVQQKSARLARCLRSPPTQEKQNGICLFPSDPPYTTGHNSPYFRNIAGSMPTPPLPFPKLGIGGFETKGALFMNVVRPVTKVGREAREFVNRSIYTREGSDARLL